MAGSTIHLKQPAATLLPNTPGARHKIRIARKHELPEFLRRLRLLGMTIDDVVKAWEERQDTKG